MGSAIAWALSGRGHKPSVFEQFAIGHSQGSSHGRSRIVRKAYPDPFYTEIMAEGYGLWADLERQSGRRLLHECGLFYFGNQSSQAMVSLLKGLYDLGVPHVAESGASGSALFPGASLLPDEVGAFTPEAGWVEADSGIRAFQELAEHNGAQFHQATTIDLGAKQTNDFDLCVVAAGAWVNSVLKPLSVALPVRASVQTFAYLKGYRPGPVWIEDSVMNLYGFPSEPTSNSMKIGFHRTDLDFDPDVQRAPDEGQLDAIRDVANRRFGTVSPEIVEAQTCVYTSTSNEDFIIDWASPTVLVVSPCSGHGFKFAPWIGQYVADLVEAKRRADEYPRFLLKSHTPVS